MESTTYKPMALQRAQRAVSFANIFMAHIETAILNKSVFKT